MPLQMSAILRDSQTWNMLASPTTILYSHHVFLPLLWREEINILEVFTFNIPVLLSPLYKWRGRLREG
jgi:hypothetical protein